jgi:hypothetical protein
MQLQSHLRLHTAAGHHFRKTVPTSIHRQRTQWTYLLVDVAQLSELLHGCAGFCRRARGDALQTRLPELDLIEALEVAVLGLFVLRVCVLIGAFVARHHRPGDLLVVVVEEVLAHVFPLLLNRPDARTAIGVPLDATGRRHVHREGVVFTLLRGRVALAGSGGSSFGRGVARRRHRGDLAGMGQCQSAGGGVQGGHDVSVLLGVGAPRGVQGRVVGAALAGALRAR